MQGDEPPCRVQRHGAGLRVLGSGVKVGLWLASVSPPPPHDGREALGLGFEAEGLVFVI